MFFNEDHLRITKPKSADGRSPLVDPETGKVVNKTISAPDNSITRRYFEEENTRLPNGLKMKIEKVPGYNAETLLEPVIDEEREALKRKVAELEMTLAANASQNLAKKESGESVDNGGAPKDKTLSNEKK